MNSDQSESRTYSDLPKIVIGSYREAWNADGLESVECDEGDDVEVLVEVVES